MENLYKSLSLGVNKLPAQDIREFCKSYNCDPGRVVYRDLPMEKFILIRIKFQVGTNYQKILVSDIAYIVTAPGVNTMVFSDYINAKQYKERGENV